MAILRQLSLKPLLTHLQYFDCRICWVLMMKL
jgi:hypothetical protein